MSNLSRKLELTMIGYLFALLNIFMTLNGWAIFGIGFGMTACYFFIQALRIKEK